MSTTILVNARFGNEIRQVELSQGDTISKINKEFNVSNLWYEVVYNDQTLKQDTPVEETELQDLCEVSLVETENYLTLSGLILDGSLKKFPLNKELDSNDEILLLKIRCADKYAETRDKKYLRIISALVKGGIDINSTLPEKY